MNYRSLTLVLIGLALLTRTGAGVATPDDKDAGFKPLFPDASLKGWKVSHWSGIDQPQQVEGQAWTIKDGILEGLGKRTWLYSEADYGDFELKFEWKITRGSNAGLGLRFPPTGDPAYKGMEIQMVDAQTYYRGQARPHQVTGAVYDEIPPTREADKNPGEWNAYHVTLRGSKLTIILNGQKIIDEDLATHKTARQQKGPALAERPRKGRIGFQNLNGNVTLRNVQIKIPD